MRVLHAVASLDSTHGGPSRSVPLLARALVVRGIACSIIHWGVPGSDSQEAIDASNGGVSIIRSTTRSIPQGVDADIVHLHGLWDFRLHRMRNLASKAGQRIVISPRGMLEPWARRHHRWRKEIAWRCFQRRDLLECSRLHATSADEHRALAAIGLTNVSIIPNGAELPNATAAFDGPRRILFMSRIHPKKGLLMLVDAVARLQQLLRAGGWQVVIAGPDEDAHERKIRHEVSTRSLNDLVVFAGMVDGAQKRRLLESAYVFVLPSYSENFGIVNAEALAAGVPVITTTATPWREIEDERCGWWVDPNVDALTKALLSSIHAGPTTLREMGLRGRRLIEMRYSWSSAAERFDQLYNALLGSTSFA
jgi:glycosyltransferase involved in cell wall biosynthesis